jgi:DMSO/TMAO reductase YedYZ molybdopterin-dependent catalytic subunit
MTRRKFAKITGAALAFSHLPPAMRAALANADPSPPNFGGPTANADFYTTAADKTPTIDAAKWTLRIHGLVDKPVSFTWDDIRRLPAVKQMLTLECIGNPPAGNAIGNAEWTGVMLRPLLGNAGIKRDAVYAVMRGADGYDTGVVVDEILREENWLAYSMNGVPLPPKHGYPLRVFIPGKYGTKQPKWLTEIEFVDREFIGYWESRGWSKSAWRKVNSGFFYPRPDADHGVLSQLRKSPRVQGILDTLGLSDGVRVKAPIDITGWALAGPSGIKRVQVSTNDGASWHEAELVQNLTPYVWTVWKYRFSPAKPGEYVVRVRATDGTGACQPERDPESRSGELGQPRMRVAVTSVA